MKYFTQEELQPSEKTLSFIRQMPTPTDWRRRTTATNRIALVKENNILANLPTR